jgi:hypothetical protein
MNDIERTPWMAKCQPTGHQTLFVFTTSKRRLTIDQ